MNREGIRQALEDEVSFEEKPSGFLVLSTTIEPSLLVDIGSYEGMIRDHDMYGSFWIEPQER